MPVDHRLPLRGGLGKRQRAAPPRSHRELIGWSIPFLGVGLGDFAVFIFFMLAGLMRAKELNLDHLDIAGYYKRRLSHLFPPFYLSYFLVLVYKITVGTTRFSVPGSHAVLTVLGLDGYVSTLFPQHQVPSFYLVGEWFFGAFVLVVLLWPPIRAAMRRHMIATLVAAIVLECSLPYILLSIGQPAIFTRLPTTCIGTFLLGAAIGSLKHGQDTSGADRNPWGYVALGMALMMLSLLIPANSILSIVRKQTLVAGLMLIVVFARHPQSIPKPSWLAAPATCFGGRLFSLGAKLSLYVFMFRHVVVHFILDAMRPSINQTYGAFDYYALMLVAIGLSFLLAFLADKLETSLRNSLAKPPTLTRA